MIMYRRSHTLAFIFISYIPALHHLPASASKLFSKKKHEKNTKLWRASVPSLISLPIFDLDQRLDEPWHTNRTECFSWVHCIRCNDPACLQSTYIRKDYTSKKTPRGADEYSSVDLCVYLIKRVSYNICEGRERRMCMSLYVTEGWRHTGSDGGEGGRGLHTLSVVWEKVSNLSSRRGVNV